MADFIAQVFADHPVSDVGAGMRHSVVITGSVYSMCVCARTCVHIVFQ